MARPLHPPRRSRSLAELLKQSAADRFTLLKGHLDTVRQRDDLTGRLIDLRLKAGDAENLKRAQEELRTRHFHSWEGRYGVHDSWVEANQRLSDLAFRRNDYLTVYTP